MHGGPDSLPYLIQHALSLSKNGTTTSLHARLLVISGLRKRMFEDHCTSEQGLEEDIYF